MYTKNESKKEREHAAIALSSHSGRCRSPLLHKLNARLGGVEAGGLRSAKAGICALVTLASRRFDRVARLNLFRLRIHHDFVDDFARAGHAVQTVHPRVDVRVLAQLDALDLEWLEHNGQASSAKLVLGLLVGLQASLKG